MIRPRPVPLALLCASLPPLSALQAGEVVKADNGIAALLTDSASWVGGAPPGAGDTAVFDATLATVGNNQHRLGGDMAWQGIRVLDPRPVNVTSGYTISAQVSGGVHTGTLTLGAGGIDLTAATAPAGVTLSFFGIGCALTLGADQTWEVPNLPTANDLFLAGSSSRPLNLGGHTVAKTGAGRVTFSGGNVVSNGLFDAQAGEVFFVNTLSLTSSTTTTQTVAETFTLRLRPGTRAAFGRGLGAGDVAWNGTLRAEDAELNLNAATNYPGALTLRGRLEAVAGQTTVTNSNASTAATPVTHSLACNLSGSGDLSFQLTTARLSDRVALTGDNSAYAGTVSVAGASGNRTLQLAAPTAGSAQASWDVSVGNVLEVTAADVEIGTLLGEGTLAGAAADAGVRVGAGHFTGDAGGTLGLTKVGPGTLTLGGTGTFTGAITVAAGELFIDGNYAAVSGGVAVGAGARLAGSGQAGPTTVGAGTLAPGRGVGSLSAQSVTFQPGSTLEWEVGDWTGVPGTGTDVLVAGAAELTSTSAAPLRVKITPRSLVNFAETARTFPLVTAVGGLTGYAADRVVVDASAFTAGTGSWAVQATPTALQLVYTPAVGDPFVSWATEQGLSGPDAGKTADPDADGFANVLEYLLGGQPNPSRPGSDSSALQPKVTLESDAVVITHRRVSRPAPAALALTHSLTLQGPWTPVSQLPGVTLSEVPAAGAADTVLVTVRVPRPAGGVIFFRLEAE